MSDKYPLYPSLTETGKEESQKIMDMFKEKMAELAKDMLGRLYCDVACHIESDSWTNYKNNLMDGLRDYNNKIKHGDFDYKEIRKSIYNEYKDEIVKDLNSDLVLEVEKLKKDIEFERSLRRY